MRTALRQLFSLYYWLFALLGALLYSFPSRRLFVLGVTGTKGKSTTLELVNAILEAAGERTALLSSVRMKVGTESVPNATGNTMPGRLAIQRFLRRAVAAGCHSALLEVTSEGICQHRHRFIDWDAALFTNLAPEHIESHGSFESYREAKLDFFRSLARSTKDQRFFFVNHDDPNALHFERVARGVGNAHLVLFSRAEFLKKHPLKLFAERWIGISFNLKNAAAAAAFGESHGVPRETVVGALGGFRGVPGRFEFVQEKPFAVVVDYAHTPDSLEQIYEALRARKGVQRLICVLGAAGGGRDRWKRPVMGALAAQRCGVIILTNEDPYDEDPEAIIRDIAGGFPKGVPHEVIMDRRAAIRRAISLATSGDTVVVTGKGNEPWIRLARGKRVPWSDRGEVERALSLEQ